MSEVGLSFHGSGRLCFSLCRVLNFCPRGVDCCGVTLVRGDVVRHGSGNGPIGGRHLRFLNSTMLSTMINSVICRRFPNGQRKFLAGAQDGLIRHSALGGLTRRVKVGRLILSGKRDSSRGDCVKKGTFRTLINTVCLSHNCSTYVGFVRGHVLTGVVGVSGITCGRIGFGDGLVR